MISPLLSSTPIRTDAWLAALGQSCDEFVSLYHSDRPQVLRAIAIAYNDAVRKNIVSRSVATGWDLSLPTPSVPAYEGDELAPVIAEAIAVACATRTARYGNLVSSRDVVIETTAPASPELTAVPLYLSKSAGDIGSTSPRIGTILLLVGGVSLLCYLTTRKT